MMQRANKRNRKKQEGMMKEKVKYKLVENKSAKRKTIATISMPRVMLHSLEKSVVIPGDVIPEILVKLTARSVGRFRCVCKSWLSITTNHSFIRAHTQHNRFTNQSLIVDGPNAPRRSREGFYLASADSNTSLGITFRELHEMSYQGIMASCDGLLYLAIYCDKYIINPLTGYSTCLPPGKGVFLGFYFHRSTSTYRIIQGTNEIVVMTDMLVIGEQSWRHLPCRFPCHLPHSSCHQSLDLNGCLFWLAFKEKSNCKQPDTIMAFDTESEVYNLLSLPPSEKLLNLLGNLVDFNGELGLWVGGKNIIDVWIMEECWVKRYSINSFGLAGGFFRLGRRKDSWIGGVAVFIKDNELLIDVSEARSLIRCNLKSGACCFRRRDVNYDVFSEYWWGGCSYPYRETLVYPDCFL